MYDVTAGTDRSSTEELAEAEQELHVRQQKQKQRHDRDWFPLVAARFNVRSNVKKVRERI